MKIKCPDCTAEFEISEEQRGKKGKCSSCGNVFRLTPEAGEKGGQLIEGLRPSGGSVFLALLLGALFVAGIFLAPRLLAGEGGVSSWSLLFGRFHPLIIHFPIALVLVAGAMQYLSGAKGRRLRASAITGILWIGAVGAVFSCAAGYILATEDGTSSVILERHMWMGIGLALLVIATLFFRIVSRMTGGGFSGFLYHVSLLASMGLVGLTAHLGGSMTHGSSYLTKHLPEPVKAQVVPMLDLLEGKSAGESEEEVMLASEGEAGADVTAEIAESPNFHAAVIQPIFDSKCVACHGEEKVKGKLRMDTHEALLAGGSEGDAVVPGDVEASLVVFRVDLPEDDDEHMPPEGKDQMTAEEVELVRWWIADGAKTDVAVADAGVPAELAGVVAQYTGGDAAEVAVATEEVPEEVVPEAVVFSDEEKTAAVTKVNDEIGARLTPTFAGAETYDFTALNVADGFGDEQLGELAPVASQVRELKLANTQITDAGLKALPAMDQLIRIDLQGTSVTDEGVKHLAAQEGLEIINLYGTAVTDTGLRALLELPNLKKVYAWETEVSGSASEAVAWFRPEVDVNTGWKDAPATPAPAPEEKKEEAKPAPAPEAKKEEPKPVPAPEAKKEEAKPAPAPEAKKEEPKPAPAPAPEAKKKEEAKPAPAPKAKKKKETKPAPVPKKEASKPAAPNGKPKPSTPKPPKVEVPEAPAPKPEPAASGQE